MVVLYYTLFYDDSELDLSIILVDFLDILCFFVTTSREGESPANQPDRATVVQRCDRKSYT
tara:strand:- start:46 stop:228 length:183 start_codon:yes stop_codon:yes gene_type:complete